MSSLHPHWNTTDADAAKPAQPASVPVHGKSVSRLPAAIIGILSAAMIGVIFLGGVNNLRGQLVEEVSITISSTAVTPNEIKVAKGTVVVIYNDDVLPHALASETLCDASGDCLKTDYVHGGETHRHTISVTASEGTHEFYSLSDPSIYGKIIVGDGSVSVSAPEGEDTGQQDIEALLDELDDAPPIPVEEPVEPDPVVEPAPVVEDVQEVAEVPEPAVEESAPTLVNEAEEEKPSATSTITIREVESMIDALNEIDGGAAGNILEEILAEEPLHEAAPSIGTESTIAAPTFGATAELPRNPYVVGSTAQHPGAPPRQFAPTPQFAPPPAIAAHKPIQQPQTGAPFWAVIVGSIGALFYWLWKSRKTHRIVTQY